MDLSSLVNISTVLANIATFLGIPLAIIVLIVDRRRARQDREQNTYQVLQSEYSDFLKLCLEHPDLQLHDYHSEKTLTLTPEQHDRQMVALEILVSMFESAYFLYHHGHRSEFKKRQWTGWEEFMRDWAARVDFQNAWRDHLGSEFDSDFVFHMNQLVKEHEKTV